MLKGGYFYGIIVGEKYFWRSNSSAAVTITLEEEGDGRVVVEVFRMLVEVGSLTYPMVFIKPMRMKF